VRVRDKAARKEKVLSEIQAVCDETGQPSVSSDKGLEGIMKILKLGQFSDSKDRNRARHILNSLYYGDQVIAIEHDWSGGKKKMTVTLV
jgi:hypothetical protein